MSIKTDPINYTVNFQNLLQKITFTILQLQHYIRITIIKIQVDKKRERNSDTLNT